MDKRAVLTFLGLGRSPFLYMNIPKIILSGLLVCLCVCGWARPVSLKQALAQAEAFYELKTVFAPRNVRSLSAKPRFELSYVAYRKGKVVARRTVSAEEACFYVVNVNGNEALSLCRATTAPVPY